VKEKRGKLERENGSVGNDGKREKAGAFPAIPARFNFFPLPSLQAFLPSTTVEASAEEKDDAYERRLTLQKRFTPV